MISSGAIVLGRTGIPFTLSSDSSARNEDLKGLPMFKSLVAENVVKMGAAQ